MNNNNNKERVTGNYRCVDDVGNFILRVSLKEVFNESIIENAEKIEVETQCFRWQEKKFGKWERDFYGDAKNCITDLDKKYNEVMLTNSDKNKLLYNYINEDEFCEHEKAADNPLVDNNYEVMHIMTDFGEYIDETWIKQEYILCTIKYIKQKKLLTIFPDFTVFEPYKLIVNGDITRIFEYTIENASDVINEELFGKEDDILNKIAIHERKMKQLIIGNDFTIPPNNKLHFFVQLEICNGCNFEYNNVFVQYFVDLPKNWSCFDQNCLRGTTQTCRRSPLFFGSHFEVILCFDLSKLPKTGFLETPYVYFEVTSKDTFDRYRVEGVAYLKLPTCPGTYRKQLKCLRILPKKISSNLRRLFIGDYMNYEDVTWFAVPKQHDDVVLNKHGVTTMETGEIEVKLNVLVQSQAFIGDERKNHTDRREKFILEKLGSSALVKSVEQVLEAFKKARRSMLAAREKAA